MLAGFFTAALPAGGRVGGCLSPLPGLVAVVEAVLGAAVPLVVRRRAVDVVEGPSLDLGDETLVGLEPLVELFLGVDWGEAPGAGELVLSGSDMLAVDDENYRDRGRCLGRTWVYLCTTWRLLVLRVSRGVVPLGT